MNKAALKNLATKARKELMERVKLQARKIGITKDQIEEASIESSDALYIDGRQLSDTERKQRDNLIARIEEIGFDRVIEETAYTWFNRLVALRFMEVNNYLPTKVRVLSSEDETSTVPDMIKEVLTLDLEIDKEFVYELKMNNDTEKLFKYLITVHCNDLNRYLPFMFETIEDYMLILFPDGLLGADSFTKDMIDTEQIPEEDWKNVEIIGWLYQYYIAEENDRVIRAKKRYKKEEIPYATQLFTPKWIVRYMVQNSLGRYWIESHPEHHDLVRSWEFYLENTNPDEEFKQKLEPYINNKLNVEDIKCFDPAMGSGHVLVYMFDILFQIYSKCGYLERDIPKLIIENNLYGLDIDKRAYQLACFSVVMKALEYNKRFLRHIERDGLTLNLAIIQETNHLNADDISFLAGEPNNENYEKIKVFLEQFKDAKAIGSLIQIESLDIDLLQERLLELENQSNDLFITEKRERLLPLFKQLIKQALIMNSRYDIFVTNPPYAGRRYLTKEITEYIDEHYPDVKSDLFSSFIEYSFRMTKKNGQMGFMTPYVWMFISSYEKVRKKIIKDRNISSLVQLEYSGFDGATVPICTFTLRNYNSGTEGEYVRLSDFRGAANQPIKTLEAVQNPSVPYRYTFNQENFSKIPESIISFWFPKSVIKLFDGPNLYDITISDGQTKTGNNDKYLRYIWEVSRNKIGEDKKWVLHAKGGEYRKWFGNIDTVINWSIEAREHYRDDRVARIAPEYIWFRKGITWTLITSGKFSARYLDDSSTFNLASPSIFFKNEDDLYYFLGMVNSKVYEFILRSLNPTLNTNISDIRRLPYIKDDPNYQIVKEIVRECIELSKDDWDMDELSIDFKKHYLLNGDSCIKNSYLSWKEQTRKRLNRLKENEEAINRHFILLNKLEGISNYQVAEEDIVIKRANVEQDIKSFISYAVGCTLGRYSLDEEGLVYAGGEFDPSRYNTFPADEDNIIPILPGAYFEDDIVTRLIDFVRVTYGSETLEENLEFIADAIGRRKNETAREAIRRYFLNNFYKDHVRTYKKRPIYWLFTSGKEKAFNCLIYMHRYDKTTLSRIRTDYLHDVQTRYDTIRNDLLAIIKGDSTASEIRSAKKELTSVERKIKELKTYDEKLHHMADMQIQIDLDDGVKVNYEKFKGLVAKI